MLQERKKKEERKGLATAWWCQWTLCTLICEEFSDYVLTEHGSIGTMQALDDPQYYDMMSCCMAELGHWDIQKNLVGSPKYIQTMSECNAHWNNSFDLLGLRIYKFGNEICINAINVHNDSTETLEQQSINILEQKGSLSCLYTSVAENCSALVQHLVARPVQ